MALTLDGLYPLDGRLIVSKPRPLQGGSRKSQGGLTLVDGRDPHEHGVIAVVYKVSKATQARTGIEPGTPVIVSEYSGTPIDDGEVRGKFWIISEGDIMALIEASDLPKSRQGEVLEAQGQLRLPFGDSTPEPLQDSYA